MGHNSIGTNDSDLIQVLDNADDFVQILGVSPDAEGGTEIEVTSVEFDEESYIIDIEDDAFPLEPDQSAIIDETDGAFGNDGEDAAAIDS